MKRSQKSLRQLAKELGVSHSYLSQIKNGKQNTSQSQQLNLATYILPCYNPDTLGISLAVGQRTLDP